MREGTRDLLEVIGDDLEATRRRLIRDASRAAALDDLLGRAIEAADRLGRPVDLRDLEADAKAHGEVELARYRGLIEVLEATEGMP